MPGEPNDERGDGLRLGFVFNLLGRITAVASGGLVAIVLARHYGVETFGRWSVATVYATLVGTLVDGGFHRLTMRDVARDPDAARTILFDVLKRRAAIAALVIPLALLAAALLTGNLTTWTLIVLLVASRFALDITASFSSVLFAFERFRIPNLVEVWRRASLIVVVGVLVASDVQIQWVGAATLVISLAGSGFVIRPALKLVSTKMKSRPSSSWSDAAWFWFNGVLFWINAEIDQLMLSRMSGDRETGLYSAAIRVIGLCMFIPRAVNDTVVRRWFASGATPHAQLPVTNLLLLGCGGLIGAQFVTFSSEIIDFLYTDKYAASSPVFIPLALFLVLHFARSSPHWFLSTSDRVRLATLILGIAATTNLAANVWAIPRYGAVGAGYVTALSELLILICAYATAARTSPAIVYAGLFGCIPGVVSWFLGVNLAGWLPWFVAAALAAGVGAVLLMLIARSFHRADVPAR